MLICIWIENSVIVSLALVYEFRKLTNISVQRQPDTAASSCCCFCKIIKLMAEWFPIGFSCWRSRCPLVLQFANFLYDPRLLLPLSVVSSVRLLNFRSSTNENERRTLKQDALLFWRQLYLDNQIISRSYCPSYPLILRPFFVLIRRRFRKLLSLCSCKFSSYWLASLGEQPPYILMQRLRRI